MLDQTQCSFADLMRGVQNGDGAAEYQFWGQFFDRLLRHVESRVRKGGIPRGLLDTEAITVSALESVYKCAKLGRLQSVKDWGELSRLLLAMTNRKFVNHWRRATAQKSYPGSVPVSLPPECVDLSSERMEACSLAFAEELSRLLDMLPDELHRRIAVLKLSEYTLAEIAADVDKAVPTINRKWRYIRRVWADELER